MSASEALSAPKRTNLHKETAYRMADGVLFLCARLGGAFNVKDMVARRIYGSPEGRVYMVSRGRLVLLVQRGDHLYTADGDPYAETCGDPTMIEVPREHRQGCLTAGESERSIL